MSENFSKNLLKRVTIIAFVILFLFSFDALRVFYISVIKGSEYSAKASRFPTPRFRQKEARFLIVTEMFSHSPLPPGIFFSTRQILKVRKKELS